MLDLLKPILETSIRHALGAGGAILVTRGLADATMVEALVGGGMAAFAVLWSLVNGVAFAKAKKA